MDTKTGKHKIFCPKCKGNGFYRVPYAQAGEEVHAGVRRQHPRQQRRATRRPTCSISGFPHALRAVQFNPLGPLSRRHRLIPTVIVGRQHVPDQ